MTALSREIDEIKERMNVKSRDIAELLGTTPQTLSRWHEGHISPSTDNLRTLLTLNYIAKEMADFLPPDEARLWLYRPHPQLGGKSPADLIEAGRTDHVLGLLNQIATGAFV